jgi:hypothetical protein
VLNAPVERSGHFLWAVIGQAVFFVWIVYISVAAVVADQGSALTAGHFFQAPKK